MPISNTLSSEPLSDDRPALRAIGRLRTTQIQYRDKLATRLEELLRAYRDDYDGNSLSAGAIDPLVTFLDANAFLKRPRVTATPSGDLFAEWTGPGETLLGVRFTESGEVQYALFAPNTLHQDRMDRASGTTTADTLMEKLSYLPDRRWLSE
jgi:hypothetical protein